MYQVGGNGNKNSTSWCVEDLRIKCYFCVFWREFRRKRRENSSRKMLKTGQNSFFFFFFNNLGGLGLLYIFLWLFDFFCTLSVCHPYLLPFADISNFGFFHFLVLTSTADLDAFSDFDWPDLGGTGKILMSSFQNTWPLENQTVGLKVMASRSELMRQARFSRFLNCFNSNFDPWAVFGNGIQYSL